MHQQSHTCCYVTLVSDRYAVTGKKQHTQRSYHEAIQSRELQAIPGSTLCAASVGMVQHQLMLAVQKVAWWTTGASPAMPVTLRVQYTVQYTVQ